MKLNVYIDTKDNYLFQHIQTHLNRFIAHIQYVSYENLKEPFIVFKEVNSIWDLQAHVYPSHTVIYILNNAELIFLALDYSPLGFIRKDQFDNDIENIIHVITKIYQNLESILTLKIGYTHIQLESSQITYIESYGHYLVIHTLNSEYRIREKISDMLKKLPINFKRIHKSIIVNQTYVHSQQGQELILNNGERLPIGRKYKF